MNVQLTNPVHTHTIACVFQYVFTYVRSTFILMSSLGFSKVLVRFKLKKNEQKSI